MKKAGYIFLTLLEIILLLGCYIITYFTKKKMGMARHIAFKNQGFEQNLDLNLIKYITVIIVAVITILVLIVFIRKTSIVSRMAKPINIMMVVTSSVFIIFTILGSVEFVKTYYYIVIFLGTVAVLQIIKAILSMFLKVSKVEVK